MRKRFGRLKPRTFVSLCETIRTFMCGETRSEIISKFVRDDKRITYDMVDDGIFDPLDESVFYETLSIFTGNIDLPLTKIRACEIRIALRKYAYLFGDRILTKVADRATFREVFYWTVVHWTECKTFAEKTTDCQLATLKTIFDRSDDELTYTYPEEANVLRFKRCATTLLMLINNQLVKLAKKMSPAKRAFHERLIVADVLDILDIVPIDPVVFKTGTTVKIFNFDDITQHSQCTLTDHTATIFNDRYGKN